MRPRRFIVQANDAGSSILDTKTGYLTRALPWNRAEYIANGFNLAVRFMRSDRAVRDMMDNVS